MSANQIIRVDVGHMHCEGHLGGFIEEGDPRTYCPQVWDYFIQQERVASMVDVGCGTGVACEYFSKAGVVVTGVDGSESAERLFRVPGRMIFHDYAQGPLAIEADLAWSSEFVEHVEEQYRHNFMVTFQGCRTVAMTYAMPGQAGHHHVNCQPGSYWVQAFRDYGFRFDEPATLMLRGLASGTYFSSGMIFRAGQ
jgi:hypothetical protein